MVIDVLSPEELARHERAIERIRRKLFASHTPEEFGIVPGSEEIISASAENLWNAGVGSYRRITWGGLRYFIATSAAQLEMTVSHFERDVFTLHVADERGHTEVASRVEFAALDNLAWRHIATLRRAAEGRRRAQLQRG